MVLTTLTCTVPTKKSEDKKESALPDEHHWNGHAWDVIPDAHTNFGMMTLFTTSRCDVDEINSTMKKYWDIDSAGTLTQATVEDADEKTALQKAEDSFRFIDGRYEFGVPWK